jgi:hypothetical protein
MHSIRFVWIKRGKRRKERGRTKWPVTVIITPAITPNGMVIVAIGKSIVFGRMGEASSTA